MTAHNKFRHLMLTNRRKRAPDSPFGVSLVSFAQLLALDVGPSRFAESS